MRSSKFIFMSSIVLWIVFDLTSCMNIQDDRLDKEYDTSILCEWIESNDNRYVFDYYCFYSDMTGIYGSYEADLDWINEDDDFEWYTINDEYLYRNGVKYKYWCNESELIIIKNGKKKYYYEKYIDNLCRYECCNVSDI